MDLTIKASVVNVLPNPISFTCVSFSGYEVRNRKYEGRKNEHQQEVHLGTRVVRRHESNLSLCSYTYGKKSGEIFEVIQDHGPTELYLTLPSRCVTLLQRFSNSLPSILPLSFSTIIDSAITWWLYVS